MTINTHNNEQKKDLYNINNEDGSPVTWSSAIYRRLLIGSISLAHDQLNRKAPTEATCKVAHRASSRWLNPNKLSLPMFAFAAH